MIQKISSNEYLRRVDNMSVAERESYLNRVGEWLDEQAPLLLQKACEGVARFQNAIQCSAGWNDDECRAWEDGARLLTAIAGKTDTWLPDMLYVKAAKRAIGQMVAVLQPVGTQAGTAAGTQKGKTKEEPAAGTGKVTQSVATFRGIGKGDHDEKDNPQDTVTIVPVRPKHIDQYVHLLPKKTQEKAATVKELLRDLDTARQKMALLMDDPKSGADSRAAWAKTATKLDEKVKGIYRELDAEWEKLVKSGCVIVDDLGNAHIVPVDNGKLTIDNDGAATELTKEQKAQIKSLRSWLRDTRGPKEAGEKHDAYVARWKEKYQEMVKLVGPDTVTEAVKNAAKLYGIELD